ncbi:MAG: integration host factor subunit beta, partial [Gammaproteobacteria bacterium]|nr:integration host factor subunit beta [Gammaproteobacteria bacterium]
MTKSELINRLYLKGNNLLLEDVAATVHVVLESMQDALGRGERIEIR